MMLVRTLRPARAICTLFLLFALPGTILAATDGFLPNTGRLDSQVLFYGASPLVDVFFTADAVVFDIKDPESLAEVSRWVRDADGVLAAPERRGHALMLTFGDGARIAAPVAAQPGPVRHSFFFGNNESGWSEDESAFRTVTYGDLWPGIDLVFTFEAGELTYELVGEDLTAAQLTWSGADAIIPGAGGQEITTTYGSLFDDGRRLSRSRTSSAEDLIFATRGVNALLWSTLFGGSADDLGATLAVASNGDIIMAGETSSPDLPSTPGAYTEEYFNALDIFVSRFSDEGSNLVWSTYIGTSSNDYCNTILLDGSDNPIIAGRTYRHSFPTTTGAYDETFNGGISDAIVTKLSSDGSSIIFSTFVGGSEVESFFDLAADSQGNIVCGGYTASTDYPTTAGCFQNFFAGPPYDMTVSILSPDGSTLLASTYVGGTDRDACRGVAVDSADDIFLGGFSFSGDFPTTAGVFQPTKSTTDDVALVKMPSDLTTLHWSTFIGGGGSERAHAVELDSAGNPVMGGYTQSSDYPVSTGSFQETYAGSMDGFVSKFNNADGTLAWSTYLGGVYGDDIMTLVMDAQDNPLAGGYTSSPNFPVNNNGYDQSHNGNDDVFVSRLAADGSALLWSSFLGGSGDDAALELAVDAADNPVVTGWSDSADFPVSSWAYGSTPGGGNDAFLARFDTGNAHLALAASSPEVGCGTSTNLVFTYHPDLPHTPPLRGYSVRIQAPLGLTFDPADIQVLSPLVGVNDTFQILENGSGDCTIDFSFLDQGAGLGAIADLFTIDMRGTAEGLSTVGVLSGVFRDEDNHPFDVDILETVDLQVDCTPPMSATLDAEPAFTAGTENSLSWSDESGSGAVDYNLQASETADFSIIVQESGFVSQLSHTFSGLTDGLTYHYRVLARDANGQVSDPSDSEMGTQDASAPSSAVDALPSAVPATFAVAFTSSDGGSGVQSVELFTNFEGGAFASAGVHTSSPISFTGTNGDGTYGFYTVATDSVGNTEDNPGVADASTQVDTTAPDVPTLAPEPLFTPGSTNTVTTSDESASGALQYRFQSSDTVDFAAVLEDSGPVDGPDHTFTGLADGSTYHFRVAALDSLGNASDFSGVVSSTQDSGAPTSTADALSHQGAVGFDVTFTAGDTGSGVQSVELFVNHQGGAFSSFGSFSQSPAAFTAADGEGLYGFYTMATDSMGNIEADPGAAQATCLLDLTAPTSAVDSLLAYQTSGVFTLTATASDNLTDVALIEWFYRLDEGSWTSAGTSPGSSFEFTAPGDGTYYFYSLATDGVGHVEEAPAEADAQTVVDTTGPTGSFVINSAASATNDTTVALAMTISGAVEMRFSNDNLAFPTGWVAYDTTAVWTLEAIEGERTVYGEFRDDAGNLLQITDSILYDLQPAGTAGFVMASPGHETVHLSWHDPDDADLAGLEIWRAVRHDGSGLSAYPEYQTVTIPAAPADREAALASSEWELAGTAPAAAQAFVDTVAPRGIYHYELFSIDEAGNFGAPSGALPSVTNYILGDLYVPFDGVVGVDDLTVLGATYGLSQGEPDFNPDADVGPTDDFSGTGLPLPDQIIDFEDLMITTNNYGLANKAESPVVAQDKLAEAVLLSWLITGDKSYTLFLESEAPGLQGVHVRADLQAGAVVRVTQGDLCADQDHPVFLRNIDSRGLDVGCALLGHGQSFTGTGALLTVTAGEGVDLEDLELGDIHIQLRDIHNGDLEFSFDQASAVDVPTAFALRGNYPNPFNPSTSIGFSLPQQESVRLEIYSVDGRRVAVLVDDIMAAGHHEVVWSGKDEAAQTVASGVYFYRIRAGGFTDVQKMTLMK